MNNVVDEIRDSLERANLITRLTPSHIIACLLTALVCGTLIYIVYRTFYKGAVYSESFNLLNVLTCLTTAFIIMTISQNLVLSLGMVGALSIVRFRAAVKDPLDIGFLFLAIAAGLTSGAGLYPLAVIGTLLICGVFMAYSFLGGSARRYVCVIKHDLAVRDAVFELLESYPTRMKSSISSGDHAEVTVSLKVKKMNIILQKELEAMDGVKSVVLMEYVSD
ncbi:MAG: DUF4956 domain-containing protein [Lachnospiraceae bacterium]|jgi:uncharacterized membrane protein YhiD involved in acid resistance|nr:DUF4956 domain-containing protein [Lachnospiraceae bacterium]